MDENRTFDQRIHDAYERVSLGDEAQERMLGALLAAQAKRQEVAAKVPESEARREEEPRRATASVLAGGRRGAHAAARSRRLPVWLPLAAAAACVFVIAGVVGGVTSGSRTSATMEVAESAKSAGEDEVLYAPSLDEEPDATVAYDMVADAAGVGATPESNAADEEAEQLQMADLYPRIVLDDGTTYSTLVEGMYTTEIEAESVGSRVGAGTASPFDADEAVACEVFELTDDEGFVVRYEGESTYWYCTKL